MRRKIRYIAIDGDLEKHGPFTSKEAFLFVCDRGFDPGLSGFASVIKACSNNKRPTAYGLVWKEEGDNSGLNKSQLLIFIQQRLEIKKESQLMLMLRGMKEERRLTISKEAKEVKGLFDEINSNKKYSEAEMLLARKELGLT